MFATSPDPERPRGAFKRRGIAALAAAASVAAFGAPSALAGPGNVELKSAYAGPISGTDARCTPEPNDRQVYGTQGPFDPTKPVSLDGIGSGYPGSQNYTTDNVPSRSELTSKLQAGEANDLCLGFTLTPNVEPRLIRSATRTSAPRLQDNPPLPEVDATYTGTGASAQVEGDDLKNVSIDAPLGYLGDPDGGPQCSTEAFGLGNFKTATCDASTQIGTAYLRVTNAFPLSHLTIGGETNPKGTPLSPVFGDSFVFNLEHGPNELGRLGVFVQPVAGYAPAKFTVSLGLAPDGSGRVRTTVEGAPRKLFNIDNVDPATGQLVPNPDTDLSPDSQIYVEAVGIRAWGKKVDHPTLAKDFSEWGTDCSQPLSADLSIETYAGSKSSLKSDPFTLTGCDALPFQPSIKVETAERRPGVPTAATVTVGLGQTTSGPKTALLKDVTAVLPAGLELGAQAGSGPNGLPLCSAADFGASDQGTPSVCPAATRVGEVSIATPLLKRPFVGSVYLGPQSAVGELPSIYVEATPEGATAADAPRVKLVGSVSVDGNGTITTSFNNNPQLRFNELRLTFNGGPNALFVTPRTCGTTSGTSTFTSWASATPVPADSSLTIDEDCATPGFDPAISMVSDNPQAGASARTTVTLARADRSPWMKDFTVALPTGFLADLNAATECGAGPAATGACPESSRIGTVTAVAGAGGSPLSLSGQMYFAERVSGSVAGAVFVVRAKIGDIDLGDVVVPARIDLRPTDAGLVLVASAPTRFKGLALNLRSFAVSLDRPGFPLNPTACGPLAVTSALVGDGGQTAAPSTQVAYTNCASLAFKPVIQASLVGDLKTGAHPEVNVSVTKARGESNLKTTTVMLPAGVASDPKNLQSVCETAAFQAGNCPASARKGSVKVNVAITSETIVGDVYLVRVAGNQLPGLGLNITGRYAQRVLSRISVDRNTGRLITTFDAIPDLPITKLDLKIDGGAGGPIIAAGTLCEKASAWDASFSGHGGQTAATALPFDCSAAGGATTPKPTAKWSRKTGLTLTFTSPKGKTIKSARVTVPSGFKITKSKSLRKKYAKVSSTGGKSKTKYTTKTLTVSASGAGPTKTKVTLRPKGLSLPKTKTYRKGLTKGKKLKIKTRVATSDGKVLSNTITVKVS